MTTWCRTMSEAAPSRALAARGDASSDGTTQSSPSAGDDLASFEALYARLRKICGRSMLSERTGHTLQGTALANEVFLRIRLHDAFRQNGDLISTRWFFAAASTAIRQVVVDHARARARQKRGGGWRRASADASGLIESRAESQDAILVADELLAELATVSPLQAQIAQLRFFCGLTFEQIGTVVGLAEHRVRREWHFAQVWLGSRPAAESWRP